MIKINVLDEEYEVINTWNDLTIEKFVKVQEIVSKAPKKLQTLIGHIYNQDKEAIEEMELSEREYLKTFPKFYGDMLEAVSDIPRSIINQIDRDSRRDFFNIYLAKFAIGCLFAAVDVEPLEIDAFEFEGEKYILPKTKKVLGEERPMGYISTIQFTEAADLDIYMREFDKGEYRKLSNIISILCLKEGEEYDEDVSLARADKFMQLTMDIAWDVFFYLYELQITYTKATLSSSLEKVKLSMQQPQMRVE